MRRTAVGLLFLAFVFGTGVQAQPAVSVRGNVGAAFMQAPQGLNDVLNSGVNVGLGTSIPLTKGFGVVLQGSFDRFTLNGDNIALLDENLSLGTEVDGGGLNLLNATFGLRYTLRNPSDAHPYISGGVGYYRTVLGETKIPENNETLPRRVTTGKGYHVALGSKFRIDETYSFFFEPRYVIVDTEESDLGTSTATRYLTVRLGMDVRL